MKKLKLKFAESNAEILTRDQLKKVIGGRDVDGSGSGVDPNGCQPAGWMCWGYINCCSGNVCNNYWCQKAP